MQMVMVELSDLNIQFEYRCQLVALTLYIRSYHTHRSVISKWIAGTVASYSHSRKGLLSLLINICGASLL